MHYNEYLLVNRVYANNQRKARLTGVFESFKCLDYMTFTLHFCTHRLLYNNKDIVYRIPAK